MARLLEALFLRSFFVDLHAPFAPQKDTQAKTQSGTLYYQQIQMEDVQALRIVLLYPRGLSVMQYSSRNSVQICKDYPHLCDLASAVVSLCIREYLSALAELAPEILALSLQLEIHQKTKETEIHHVTSLYDNAGDQGIHYPPAS